MIFSTKEIKKRYFKSPAPNLKDRGNMYDQKHIEFPNKRWEKECTILMKFSIMENFTKIVHNIHAFFVNVWNSIMITNHFTRYIEGAQYLWRVDRSQSQYSRLVERVLRPLVAKPWSSGQRAVSTSLRFSTGLDQSWHYWPHFMVWIF